jgi:hypothetical protein
MHELPIRTTPRSVISGFGRRSGGKRAVMHELPIRTTPRSVISGFGRRSGGKPAVGVGLTLTAASHVIFAELDWRPAMITQAEDRAHRIGQRESVLVQHIVFDGSLDATMAQKIVEKRKAR